MRELEPNIPISGLEDYHITKRGNLYSKKKGRKVLTTHPMVSPVK